MGERDGKTIAGFDCGNSPFELTSKAVCGRKIFMTTSNGIRTLEMVRDAPMVFAAALVNRRDAVRALLAGQPERVAIVGSGWHGAFSVEDAAGAGAILVDIREEGRDVPCTNDEARAAEAIFSQWRGDLPTLRRRSAHGWRLIALRAEEDVEWCAELDCLQNVPWQAAPGVLVDWSAAGNRPQDL